MPSFERANPFGKTVRVSAEDIEKEIKQKSPFGASEAAEEDTTSRVALEMLSAPEGVTAVREKPKPLKDKLALDPSHKFALRYAPEFLGKGGDNIVYEIPGRSDIVVKGSTFTLYQILKENVSTAWEDSIEHSDVLQKARSKLKHEQKVESNLIKYFGGEHILRSRKYLMKVPITDDIAQAINDQHMVGEFDNVPPGIKEAWTVVTIQRKQDLKQGGKQNVLHASSGNPDRDQCLEQLNTPSQESREPYCRVTDALMTAETAGDVTEEEFLEIIGSEDQKVLFRRMKEDPELAGTVRDFVEKAIDFAEETGEILDLAGGKNIVFLKEGGRWTYKMLDPIYGFYTQAFAKAREAYLHKKKGNEDFNTLFQSVNFVRTINALAKASGSNKYLNFLPPVLLKDSVGGRILEFVTGPKKN